MATSPVDITIARTEALNVRIRARLATLRADASGDAADRAAADAAAAESARADEHLRVLIESTPAAVLDAPSGLADDPIPDGEPLIVPMAEQFYNEALSKIREYHELAGVRNRNAAVRARMEEVYREIMHAQMGYNVARGDRVHAEVPPEIRLPTPSFRPFVAHAYEYPRVRMAARADERAREAEEKRQRDLMFATW